MSYSLIPGRKFKYSTGEVIHVQRLLVIIFKFWGVASILDKHTGSYMKVFDRAADPTDTQPIVINHTNMTFLELIMIYIDRE